MHAAYFATTPGVGDSRKITLNDQPVPDVQFGYATERENAMLCSMNSRVGEPIETPVPEAVEERPFRLLTLFDSPESSAEAASASQHILQELGEEVAVDKNSWDVRQLDSAVLRGRAAEQAANADIIVIALTAREPSEPLRQWLEQWQKNRSVDGGLLVLIPAGEAENIGILTEFVSEAAISANMDFLSRKQPRF
jgi:hypothetical protein